MRRTELPVVVATIHNPYAKAINRHNDCVRLRHPQDKQDYQQDDYSHCQQVAEREPWTSVAAHTLSFSLGAVPVDLFRHNPDTQVHDMVAHI
jgi:hypothetical protein